MRPEPKFKVGQLLIDNTFDSEQKAITDKYAIGEIIQVIIPGNFDISGYYYQIDWSDNEGNDDAYAEDHVQEYRDKYLDFSKKCQKELQANG